MPRVPSLPRTRRSGLGPAPLPGSRRRLPDAHRCHHTSRLDEVVDMGMVRGVMAAGAGRYPTSERRKFKALREMTQCESVGPQLVFQGRTVDASLDQGGAGKFVNLQDLVQGSQVDGYHSVEVPGWLYPSHGGTATAVGNHRVTLAPAPVHNPLHLMLVTGECHYVGRVGELEAEGLYPVGKAPAVAVHRPLMGVGRAVGGHRWRRRYSRLAKIQVGAFGHWCGFDCDPVLGGESRGFLTPLLQCWLVFLHTPGPETSFRHSGSLPLRRPDRGIITSRCRPPRWIDTNRGFEYTQPDRHPTRGAPI